MAPFRIMYNTFYIKQHESNNKSPEWATARDYTNKQVRCEFLKGIQYCKTILLSWKQKDQKTCPRVPIGKYNPVASNPVYPRLNTKFLMHQNTYIWRELKENLEYSKVNLVPSSGCIIRYVKDSFHLSP